MGDRIVFLLTSLTLIYVVSFIHGFLEIIPERAAIEYLNNKYIQNAKLYIRKTGRRGIYVAHLDFSTNTTFTNNLTVHIVLYELLHNEYRRSFVEMHFKLCNMLEKDPFAGKAASNAGLRCPVVPGEHKLRNMTLAIPEVENMKWVFPHERTKAQTSFVLSPGNITVAVGHVMFTIRQTLRKTKT